MLRALALAVLVTACASTASRRPQLKVIGSTERRLVVEIHNPTDYPIELDAFDWTLVAGGRRIASGTLELKRAALLPEGSTIVELPVVARPSGAYTLDGRLRADDRATWRVSVQGRFQ